MSYISYDKQPAIVNEPTTYVLNFDETEIKVTDMIAEEERDAYTYETIRINKNDYNYGGIVNAIVRYKYSESQVEAIVLNGTDTADHKAEYDALQAWRSHAKEVAKAYLGMN